MPARSDREITKEHREVRGRCDLRLRFIKDFYNPKIDYRWYILKYSHLDASERTVRDLHEIEFILDKICLAIINLDKAAAKKAWQNRSLWRRLQDFLSGEREDSYFDENMHSSFEWLDYRPERHSGV